MYIGVITYIMFVIDDRVYRLVSDSELFRKRQRLLTFFLSLFQPWGGPHCHTVRSDLGKFAKRAKQFPQSHKCTYS
jgi:hypothetical protein